MTQNSINYDDPIMETYSGEQINVEYVYPDQIKIADIAHALSLTCRFNGHCNQFYSVAEHCNILAHYVYNLEKNREKALYALLHDASEAYLGDVIRPIKSNLGAYIALEKTMQASINLKFQVSTISTEDRAHVAHLDTCILHDEKKALFAPEIKWDLPGEPLGVKIYCLNPLDAQHDFMNWFAFLTAKTDEAANAA